MIYMVTNNEIVACLSSLIPENIIAGSEILGVSGSAQTGSNVTLGVVDANNNFQSLAFDGTSSVTSGEPISTSSYQTWNSPYNTSVTPEPEEETGADITASYQAVLNYDNSVNILAPHSSSENSYNGYVWYKYNNSNPALIEIQYNENTGFSISYWYDDDEVKGYKSDGNIHNIIGTYSFNNGYSAQVTKVTE